MKKKHRVKEFIRKLHHKKGMRWMANVGFMIVLPVVGLYAHFIEPKLVKVSNIRIPIPKLPKCFNHFRIVQISDLHYGPTNQSVKFFEKCIRKINQLKPDLVALTGDYVQWDTAHLRILTTMLAKIKSVTTLAILGNHDYGVCHAGEAATDPVDYQEVIDEFQKQGIRVLHNEVAHIEKEKDVLNIVGIGDYWTSHFKPEKAFSGKKENAFATIVLCHNPDGIDSLKNYPFNLMLSGHSHGGQISFPFLGPLSVPVKNRKHRRGLHRVHDKWLYTNRGLGYIFKARLLSRPEITCLELVSGI